MEARALGERRGRERPFCFDAPFTADYHLFSRWGGGTSPYEADFVNRSGGGGGFANLSSSIRT